MTAPHYLMTKYKRGRLCGATYRELLNIAFGEAILGCTDQESDRVQTALQVLVEDLDQNSEIILAREFTHAFKLCLKLISRQQFVQARDLLQALRTSWQEAHILSLPQEKYLAS